MKTIFLITFFIITGFASFALHTKGGWMYYEYLGPGINDPAKLRYKIVLKLYMICTPSSGQLDQQVNFSFFNAGSNQFIENETVPLTENPNIQNCNTTVCHPCISNVPSICYKIATYEIIKELSPSSSGYTISYQRCCRIPGIVNVINSSNIGDTWTINIPGTQLLSTAPQNSSPKFIANDTAIVCAGNFFTFNFTATDPDGDFLTYAFGPAYTGASSGAPSPGTAANPPYTTVPYALPFSSFQPLGAGVTINTATGIVSGIAPASGEYVLTAVVTEYRNGVYIGEARKSLHIQVADCAPTRATLQPEYISCNGYTVTFSNLDNNSSIQNCFWDFGVPSQTNDTSTSFTPTFTYPDTGTYIIKLVVNKGLPCTDSATAPVRVYPGFFPGFRWSGICINAPIQFTDTTRAIYGIVNKWSWNFGDPSTLADTSHVRNPAYTYTTPGNYNVTFIVGSNKGCVDTVIKVVPIMDKPVINVLFRDTSYCGRDTIQLHASSATTGNYSWTPLTNIINPNTADPLVYPTAVTKYFVTLDAGGCTNRDSVTVRPLLNLTTTATVSPATICEEDTVTLTATSNHTPVQYLWSPAATVLNPTAQTTIAYPAATTTYTVTARWGNNCVATSSKTVTVKPLAIPNAGPDAAFCAGTNGVQLNASGGNNYTWTPAAGLSATNIANPMATPLVTTTYIVSVGVTGCTKTRTDSITITVRPKPPISLTNDTLICSIDTLQLNATGTGNFFWTPNYNINNQNIQNPLVSPDVPTKYFATLTDQFGCVNKDSVFVNVKQVVTLDAGNDTSICRTDAITLKPVSDALHYKWRPAGPLNYDTLKYPTATPLATTTFYVIANIGKCQATDSVRVKVTPYPIAFAGNDTTICYGNAAQLQATGGSIYSWSPALYLNNSKIPNPVSTPLRSMRYIVTVKDTLGCPKPVTDTVFVTVYPKVIADAGPRDTLIVINQPLQLNATGGQIYLWSPTRGLNNAAIADPVAILDSNITYTVTVSNAAGCFATDTIRVTVYKVTPGLYVPNAFTPNGDGLNDVFRPIPIGMKEITSFKVYNRWGQLMFSSSIKGQGWDGRFKGSAQDPAVYVWIVEGIDYLDKKIKQKGTVILVR